jgi:hypothetical protein
MFNFNLITGSLFTAGVMNGFNARGKSGFKSDPYAHYKLMGTAFCMGSLVSLGDYIKEHYPNTKSRFSSHMIGGGLGGVYAAGTAYCMGLMLTKIPSKTEFDFLK